MTTQDRVERLYEKAQDLQERADAINQMADNFNDYFKWNIPENFGGNEDDFRRLVLNNERYGIKNHFGMYSVNLPQFVDFALQGYIIDTYTHWVIGHLAEAGDPLCQLLDVGYENYTEGSNFWNGINPEEIAAKIISRRGLTEKKYQIYINILNSRFKRVAPNKPKPIFTKEEWKKIKKAMK